MIIEGTEYLKKLRSPFNAQAVFMDPKSQIHESQKEQRMELEGKEMLRKTEGFIRIALSEDGQSTSSEQFASFFALLTRKSSRFAFIVGGAFGLSAEVIATCDYTLSLSPMTMPHRLAFLVLCEQIYRGHEILRFSPYHK